MADNTLLNAGTGGDTIRDVAKTANSPAKTQMVILDVGGGADASPETALVLGQAVKASSIPVTIASDQPAVPVSGTFWQATQPVSATSLPLPGGAATSALQPAINVDGGALAHVTNFPKSQSAQSLKDSSGSIITGTTSQAALAAGSATQYLLIQNPGYYSNGTAVTNPLFLNFGADSATFTSIVLVPGASFVMEVGIVSNDQINLMAADAGHPYTIKYF